MEEILKDMRDCLNEYEGSLNDKDLIHAAEMIGRLFIFLKLLGKELRLLGKEYK